MRRAPIFISAVFVAFSLGALAVEPPKPAPANDPAKTVQGDWRAPRGDDREEEALAFVREHHPELATLLAPLKAMKPKEYERAIAELSRVSRTLGGLNAREPRRYEVGLEAWKAKSKADLVAAKWVNSPTPELESQLREALDNELAARLRQQELEQEIVRSRLKKIDESIDRLKNKRDTVIESRLRALRKKADAQRKTPPKRNASAQAKSTQGDPKK
jgi:hypothetical protein